MVMITFFLGVSLGMLTIAAFNCFAKKPIQRTKRPTGHLIKEAFCVVNRK
jgi:hypothetical protein